MRSTVKERQGGLASERAREALRGAAWVAAALIMWTGAADAQSLGQARSLYFEADFEGAIDGFQAVLDRPDATRRQIVEAHRYLAGLRTALGQGEAAEQHAAAALALDPEVAPPEGAPPEAQALFARLKARPDLHAARLAIDAEPELQLTVPSRIVARLSPAPPLLFETLTLRCEGAGTAGQARGSPPSLALELAPTASSPVECHAEALTAAGAALVARARTLPLVTPPATEQEEDAGGPLAWHWAVGGVGAAALIAVIVGIAVSRSPDRCEAGTACFRATEVEGW